MWIEEPSSAEDAKAFLIANDYPHDWPVEYLRLALLLRVGTSKETYAWIWFAWLRENDKVLAIHVCARQDVRGKWVTEDIVDRVTTLVEMLKTTMVVAYPHRGVRIMRRFGFEVIGDIAFRFINQEEESDGSVQQAGCRPGADAGEDRRTG